VHGDARARARDIEARRGNELAVFDQRVGYRCGKDGKIERSAVLDFRFETAGRPIAYAQLLAGRVLELRRERFQGRLDGRRGEDFDLAGSPALAAMSPSGTIALTLPASLINSRRLIWLLQGALPRDAICDTLAARATINIGRTRAWQRKRRTSSLSD
jgi:hypothetical protein